eukprot:1506463-Rhodomonas_salina.3
MLWPSPGIALRLRPYLNTISCYAVLCLVSPYACTPVYPSHDSHPVPRFLCTYPFMLSIDISYDASLWGTDIRYGTREPRGTDIRYGTVNTKWYCKH